MEETNKKQKEWEAENREQEKCKREQLEWDQVSRREHRHKMDLEMQQIWDNTNQEIAREKKIRTEELTREFDEGSAQRHSKWATEREERERRQRGELGSRHVARSRERSLPQ